MTTKQAKQDFNYFVTNIGNLHKMQTNILDCYVKPSRDKELAFDHIIDFSMRVEENHKRLTSAVYITSYNTFQFTTMFGIYGKDNMTIEYVVKDTKNNRYVFDKDGKLYITNEMYRYL